MNEREIALEILLKRQRDGGFSNVLIKDALDRRGTLSASQRAFIKRLSEGTLERSIEMDARINRFSKKPADQISAVARAVLQLGIYQICYMDAVPDSAAVNEAVKLIKKRGRENLAGFVNALLRNTIRARAEDIDPLTGADKWLRKQDITVRYSTPAWLCRQWIEQYGRQITRETLEAYMKIRPVSIRFDERMTSEQREKLIAQMEEAGVKVEKGKWLPYCYHLYGTSNVAKLPGFKAGRFTVQDESSMMVTEAAGLKGGETVVDVCAAPGGKSMHAAERLLALDMRNAEEDPRSAVLSFDIGKAKIEKIRENAARMRLSNLTAASRDAKSRGENSYEKTQGSLNERADVLFCDVPCSGLGVIGKKRDIKYNVTAAQIDSLLILQREIVRASLRILKPGGVLIYSTCTLNKRENEEMALFIEKELGMIPEDLAGYLPKELPGIEKNCLQMFPGTHGTDGFFLARFRKPAE